MTFCGITSRTRLRGEQLAAESENSGVYEVAEDLIDQSGVKTLLILASADQTSSVVEQLRPFGLPLFTEKSPGLSPEQTSKSL